MTPALRVHRSVSVSEVRLIIFSSRTTQSPALHPTASIWTKSRFFRGVCLCVSGVGPTPIWVSLSFFHWTVWGVWQLWDRHAVRKPKLTWYQSRLDLPQSIEIDKKPDKKCRQSFIGSCCSREKQKQVTGSLAQSPKWGELVPYIG